MTDLPTLRAKRDAAREAHWNAVGQRGQTTLDALLALHAQVTTLENAEKLEHEAKMRHHFQPDTSHYLGWTASADFLRATVEGA